MFNRVSNPSTYTYTLSAAKMDSIIETQRQTHEELERYEQALAEVLMQNPTVVSPVALALPFMTTPNFLCSNVTSRVAIVKQPTY